MTTSWSANLKPLITGYNTDVEYGGVVYHVQTEDKGLDHPIILSLVYVEGAILASKRSPYDDLVTGAFDEAILTQRLQRQHKLICAAVQSGRIEELKRLGERQPPLRSTAPLPKAPIAEKPKAPEAAPAVAAVDDDAPLTATLLEDGELRAGETVTLQILVTRPAGKARKTVPGAEVTVKTLGTKFRPEEKTSTTAGDGIASFSLSLPKFTGGRAAILIRAEADGEVAELRRIILPE
ncbi:MAG: hypothetical protein AABM67_09210 [Acidobacteriota bacterium]